MGRDGTEGQDPDAAEQLQVDGEGMRQLDREVQGAELGRRELGITACLDHRAPLGRQRPGDGVRIGK